MKTLVEVEYRSSAETPRADVSFLPPMARRRLTELERIFIHVAYRAREKFRELHPGESLDMPIVFASHWGEIGTTLKLMQQMFSEGEMSPAGFSNSVHNAASGVFSILTKNRKSYTAIAANENTYEMGLLEASLIPGRVLFVYAEEATPEMYRAFFPSPCEAHARALIIENE